jgi:hypothetical protein
MHHVPFEITLKKTYICAQSNCKKALREGKIDCTDFFAIASMYGDYWDALLWECQQPEIKHRHLYALANCALEALLCAPAKKPRDRATPAKHFWATWAAA